MKPRGVFVATENGVPSLNLLRRIVFRFSFFYGLDWHLFLDSSPTVFLLTITTVLIMALILLGSGQWVIIIASTTWRVSLCVFAV
jgi:hypothetical protein